MTVTVYGIKNCDTIKKARKFLDANNIEYRFHDYRTDGTDQHQVQRWIDEFGWETVLNKRGTTWRKLPETTKESINANTAASQLCAEPAMIKRPVLDTGNTVLIGFTESRWTELLLGSG